MSLVSSFQSTGASEVSPARDTATIDRSKSPQRRDKINHSSNPSNWSNSSSGSTSSRPSYKLFPTVEPTPADRTIERRGSCSQESSSRPSTPSRDGASSGLAVRRGRKISLSLLRPRTTIEHSQIPQVTVTAPPNTKQLNVPIELSRSKSTSDDGPRTRPSEQIAPLTTANVESLDLAMSQAATNNTKTIAATAIKSTASAKRKLDEHLASSKNCTTTKQAAAPGSPQRPHHTRQSSSLSTIGSDDVAYFGSAGLSTISVTQKVYSPVGAGLKVREVIVAPPKDRTSRPKIEPTRLAMHDSDSDTCVPPPLFTSRIRAKPRSQHITRQVSNEDTASLPMTPKSAPPVPMTHRPATPGPLSTPAFINVIPPPEDKVEEVPVPKVQKDQGALRALTNRTPTPDTSSRSQSPAQFKATESAIKTRGLRCLSSEGLIPVEDPVELPKIELVNVNNLPKVEPITAKDLPNLPVNDIPVPRPTRTDPVQRMADLAKQGEALHARYDTLRTHRLKLTTSIAASLKEMRAGPEYANLLLHQHQSLNATNSSIDICFAKLKALECKKERAIAILVAQLKSKTGGDETPRPERSPSDTTSPSVSVAVAQVTEPLPKPKESLVYHQQSSGGQYSQRSRAENPCTPPSTRPIPRESSKPAEQQRGILRVTSAANRTDSAGMYSESDSASPVKMRRPRVKPSKSAKANEPAAAQPMREARPVQRPAIPANRSTTPQGRRPPMPARAYTTPTPHRDSSPHRHFVAELPTPPPMLKRKATDKTDLPLPPALKIGHRAVAPPVRPPPPPPRGGQRRAQDDSDMSLSTTASSLGDSSPEEHEVRTPRHSGEIAMVPGKGAKGLKPPTPAVNVLSGEAYDFWEFCEGSFRLSRTPCNIQTYGPHAR